MRSKLLLTLTVLILISVNSFSQDDLLSPIHKGKPHIHSENEILPNTTGQSGTGANIDVLYHKIFWRINPDSAVKYIRGNVQTNFKTIVANVTSISFDLNSVLLVDSVRFRGARLPAGNITRAGHIVTIALGATLANNFIDSLTIYYRGTPPAATGAAQGYQRGVDATAGNYINTLSESYEDRDWWPCKADMQDKIDSMDIRISVPWATPTAGDTFWVASNGKLVDSAISGNNRIFTFKHRYPIATYLVSVCVAKYNKYHRNINLNGTNIPVVYNLFRGKSAASYTNILAAMDSQNVALRKFSTKFGDYPFKNEKHGFYEGLGGAAGMEHQTFSAIASGFLTSLPTLTHELAHQWFGDNVTFATWNDLWLAEGFARYSEALFREIVSNSPALAFTTRNTIKTDALANTTQSTWIPDGFANNSNNIWTTPYGGNVYDRGAMIVSMLRSLSGDTKFYQALTNYQTQYTGKAVTTDSLKNKFNEVLGMNINEFFRDYVGGSGKAAAAVGGVGHPTNQVIWDTTTVGGTTTLYLKQGTQTRTAGTNVTYFNGPVVVKATNGVKDTTITYFDWGGGTLSYAGDGLSDSVRGNLLAYPLSFIPTSMLYDDSARTMTQGTTAVSATNIEGYIWYGGSDANWNNAANWSACCGVPPVSGADITIATTINQPTLPANISVRNLTINTGKNLNIGNFALTITGKINGTGTLTGSAISELTLTGNAGDINFNQASAATNLLNKFTMVPGSSANLNSMLTANQCTVTGSNLIIKTGVTLTTN